MLLNQRQVFNLVNQHDSQVNATIATESANIAREAKSDSSSMKTIAALTMVFLPGTYIAAIFGMNFFDYSAGSIHVSGRWWLYVAITIPMTILTIGTWWAWTYVSSLARFAIRGRKPRRSAEDESGMSLATFDTTTEEDASTEEV